MRAPCPIVVAHDHAELPLRVEKLYNEYDAPAAFAVASLLALLALLTLGIKTVLEWKQHHEFQRAQTQTE